MKRHLLTICANAALLSPAVGQILIEKLFQVNQTITDNGQYVDVRALSDFGMTSILDVNVGLVMQSAAGKTMRLGDYFVSLTYGIASEEERVAVLLNRAGANETNPWGSSLNAENLSFDDSGDAPNSFGITSATGTYAADGRLAVDPYGSPLAFKVLDVTHGLDSLNGDLLDSNIYNLLVADTRQGGVGMLSSWTLGITGNVAESGTLDLGPAATIADVAGSGSQEVKAGLLVSGSGTDSLTAKISENLVLSGALTGNGSLRKSGGGELTLSGNSSDFTGKVELSEGVLRIDGNNALGAGAKLEVSGIGTTLKLANSSRVNAPISLANTQLVIEGDGELGGALTGNGSLRNSGGGELTLSGNSSDFTGKVELSEGVLRIDGNNALGAGAKLEVSGIGSTLKLVNSSRVNAPISLANAQLVIEGDGELGGALTGNGSLRNSGGGELTLSGNSSDFTGKVELSEGVLRINGDYSGATGEFSVASGATLGGNGTIGGPTTVTGTHSPGNSPGLQIFDSLLTYSAGSSILWELGVNAIGTRGSDYDGIDVNGGLNFAGATTVSLVFGGTVDWGTAFWDSDQIGTAGWKIFDVVGALDGVDNLSLDSTEGWLDSNGVDLSARRSQAGFNLYQESGGIYLNYQAAVVPEPSYLLGVICLLVGWASCRRR